MLNQHQYPLSQSVHIEFLSGDARTPFKQVTRFTPVLSSDPINSKNPFSDGTTHILFSPLDFLSKLAALVPRPRHNLVRYHGVFARGCHQPNAKLRKLIVPKSSKKSFKKPKNKRDDRKHKTAEQAASRDELVAPLTWAQRLKRVFNMTGPPSDYCVSPMWWHHAYHRTGPPSDHRPRHNPENPGSH